MAVFKLTISDPKTGRSVQREVKDKDAAFFMGKKIGEKINGESFGLTGYEFELTGGSDNAGFPMRWDVKGTGRKKILAVSGVGIKKKRKGQKQRKNVCGNIVSATISQINLKITAEGKTKLFEEKKDIKEKGEKKPEETKEAKKEEMPKEKQTTEKKAEEKPKKISEKPKEGKKIEQPK